MMSAVLWMVLLACNNTNNGAPISLDKDTPSDTETEMSCDISDPPSGEAVGSIDCDDGRCEVESGPFWMGDVNGYPDACPMRQVTLSDYSIDQYEVTHAKWQSCVDAGVCPEPKEHCWSMMLEEGLNSDNMPVTCVTWQEAADYCEWADGRLPTEAEWEKAARGTSGAEWPWGSTPPDCNLANYRFSSTYCFSGVIEVGHYTNQMSPYGLYDMVGNAWEWVADWYDPEIYTSGVDTDPTGTSCDDGKEYDPLGGLCTFRVVRGGAFNTTKETTRTHRRSIAEPWVPDQNMGFRCAYD